MNLTSLKKLTILLVFLSDLEVKDILQVVLNHVYNNEDAIEIESESDENRLLIECHYEVKHILYSLQHD